MDASACMKSLLLAASQYRTARTQPNAALLQRSLEVRLKRLRGGGGCSGTGRADSRGSAFDLEKEGSELMALAWLKAEPPCAMQHMSFAQLGERDKFPRAKQCADDVTDKAQHLCTYEKK